MVGGTMSENPQVEPKLLSLLEALMIIDAQINQNNAWLRKLKAEIARHEALNAARFDLVRQQAQFIAEDGDDISRNAARAILEIAKKELAISGHHHQITDRDSQSYTAYRANVLDQLAGWRDAYPTDVFPEPDLQKARELLEAGGMTLDSISAHIMRQCLAETIRIVKNADEETL
jgi:hypothetical protein